MRGKVAENGKESRARVACTSFTTHLFLTPVKNKYTRHEFLKLYTIDKPKNDFEKTQNKLNRGDRRKNPGLSD